MADQLVAAVGPLRNAIRASKVEKAQESALRQPPQQLVGYVVGANHDVTWRGRAIRDERVDAQA